MSKFHKCNDCGEIQATGWGEDFTCSNCGGTDGECLDHDKSEH